MKISVRLFFFCKVLFWEQVLLVKFQSSPEIFILHIWSNACHKSEIFQEKRKIKCILPQVIEDFNDRVGQINTLRNLIVIQDLFWQIYTYKQNKDRLYNKHIHTKIICIELNLLECEKLATGGRGPVAPGFIITWQ